MTHFALVYEGIVLGEQFSTGILAGEVHIKAFRDLIDDSKNLKGIAVWKIKIKYSMAK